MSRIVQLASIEDATRHGRHIGWALVLSQEWTVYEVVVSPSSIITWIFSDEEITVVGQGRISEEDTNRTMQKPWADDGRST
eukprot:5041410-Pyramimonas_sp.AAC.1